MTTTQLSYQGVTESAVSRSDWLVLEQQDVPASQQVCTVDSLRKMLDQAMVGQSARSYVSDACPVEKRREGNRVIISYTATILMHRSASLFNGYDLTPSEGSLGMVITVQRSLRRSYTLDKSGVVFLEWLPVADPVIAWQTRVYDSNNVRVFIPELNRQDNGFLYFADGYSGFCEVSGLAVVDKVQLTIEHQQGYQFDKTILLTAEWGPEDKDGNRESAQLEVRPPQCWIDEAKKCADPNFFASYGLIDDGGDSPGYDVELNPDDDEPTTVMVGFCSGEDKGTE